VIVGAVVWLSPASQNAINSGAAGARIDSGTGRNDYKKMAKIIETRCYQCHGAEVQMKNVRLDSPALVKQHAQSVYQQVVVTKLMPMNNSTGVTDDERAQIKAWFEAGAKTE
jgi:uncharacterized membrane protein